ncbi:MAG: hypothetical protein CMC19_05925 [Flavobacteriaceae bacterium]|nr:hypothetical protein [Flavobacteriaceae bacterium]OUX39880.1 MAG: hypothetical protein CBE25_02495 [Flavobacteriaceae bacterium TMED265]
MFIKCLNKQYLQGFLGEKKNLRIVNNGKVQEKILTRFCKIIGSLIMKYTFYRCMTKPCLEEDFVFPN